MILADHSGGSRQFTGRRAQPKTAPGASREKTAESVAFGSYSSVRRKLLRVRFAAAGPAIVRAYAIPV